MTSTSPPLRQTPLHALHLEKGARMVPFAGYDMPVQYPQGLLAEHRHTREQASVFDVSHMGMIRVSGPDAALALEQVLPSDIVGLPPNRMRYSLLLNEQGGILDDLMVINRGADFILIVNAACKQADLQWLQVRIGALCQVTALHDMGLIALQGPKAGEVLQRIYPATANLLFMHSMNFGLRDAQGLIMRSGYTGEDGFELALPVAHLERIMRGLLAQPEVQLAGLGARNSLRLEAGLCLYGNDMDASTDPVEAGLTWAISPVRCPTGTRPGGFAGAPHIFERMDQPSTLTQVRVGLHGLERIPVRDGSLLHRPLFSDAPQGEFEIVGSELNPMGRITSGLLSPTLDRPIAMGYVPPSLSTPGTLLHAMVRGKPVTMEVVPLPFVAPRYRKN